MKIILTTLLIFSQCFASAAEPLPEIFVGNWGLDGKATNEANHQIAKAEGKIHVPPTPPGLLPVYNMDMDGNFRHKRSLDIPFEEMKLIEVIDDCYILSVKNVKSGTSYVTLNWVENKRWISRGIDTGRPGSAGVWDAETGKPVLMDPVRILNG